MFNIIFILLILMQFIIINICIYYIFGMSLFVVSKFNGYISKIQNAKIINRLTFSFMCTIVYGTFLIFVKEKLIIQSYYFILSGLIVNYIVNFDLLLKVIKNPKELIGNIKLRQTINVKKEALKNMWSGTIMVIFFIIINLFLGVLTIYNIDSNAYFCTINSNQIDVLDLVYYTIVTFTTIGYGDIVPNALESKVMAIIISFTSVICLIIFISSMLSAGSNYIRNSRNSKE